MEYGVLSVIPSILAITLAIVTKEVYTSLLVGIFTGCLILTDFNPLLAFTKMFDNVFSKMGDAEWNVPNMIFILFLGSLITVITAAGGSRAFAEWASSKIKNRAWAQGAAWLLGLFIFIDDYFNSLTIGAIVKPVTDKYRVSRAKLAYILDSTAAPVCIIAPISSWIAYVTSIFAEQFKAANLDLSPYHVFMQVIPWNFYALLTIIMVGIICFSDLEFGPMAKFEYRAIKTGQLNEDRGVPPSGDDLSGVKVSDKGKAIDLILPLVALIILTVIWMLYTGGFFAGASLNEAFANTNAVASLAYAAFICVVFCGLLYIPRGLLTFNDFMASVIQGMKSMVPTLAILALAWTLGGISSELGTGTYVANLFTENISAALMPAIIFIISCFISFSIGSSYGTFAIMLPIAIPMAVVAEAHLLSMIAAVLAGGVLGDHCSPISDTTIMSSTGASCHHIDHVTTQLPYAVTVGIISLIGFLVGGFINNVTIVLPLTMILLVATLKVLHNITIKNDEYIKRFI